MMKQCVFLFLFSLGAHGIRLQPSRQSLQQALDAEPQSVNDILMPTKQTYVAGQVINTCYFPWDSTVSQLVEGANWVPVTYHAASFKEKTSHGDPNLQECETYLANLRDETQSPIINPDTGYGLATDSSGKITEEFTPGKHFGLSCTEANFEKQTYARNMIYDWKHNNYGGNFRIPSWLYLCAGMTANGDPHVVNILGETFDIVSQGEVELVRYPKGADDSSSKLIITASIDKLGQGCHDTYMKKITVSGAWLKEAISFKDDEDNGHVLVSQGSDARLAPVELNRMNGSDAVKLDSKQIHFLNPKRASLTVAGVTQVVVYTAGRPHKGVGTYLNLDLQGFTNLEGKVGGLLGQDSHKKELDLSKDLCKKSSVAKSRAFHQKGNDVPLHEDDRLFHVEIH